MATHPITQQLTRREHLKIEKPISLKISAQTTLDGKEYGLAFTWDESEGEAAFDRRVKALRWSIIQAISSLRGDWGEQQRVMAGAIVGAPADPEAFG